MSNLSAGELSATFLANTRYTYPKQTPIAALTQRHSISENKEIQRPGLRAFRLSLWTDLHAGRLGRVEAIVHRNCQPVGPCQVCQHKKKKEKLAHLSCPALQKTSRNSFKHTERRRPAMSETESMCRGLRRRTFGVLNSFVRLCLSTSRTNCQKKPMWRKKASSYATPDCRRG